MADGDAGRCEPYRAEWRRHVTTGWMLLGKCDTLGDAEAKAQRAMRDFGGGQGRVLEQRVVLVRGLGQDGGPDEAFVEWQRTQPWTTLGPEHTVPPPSGHAEFFERNREAAERQAADTMAQAETLRDPAETRHDEFLREHERRMGRVDEALARLRELTASVRERNERIHGAPRSVVSDPDDRRDVEAAADAGQPLSRWSTTTFHTVARPVRPDQFEAIRKTKGTVADMAGCVHRMSSGAVSLTACGECGADPGDPCADAIGDRIARAGRDGGEHVADNLRHVLAKSGRTAAVHRTLDHLAVPRHAEPEQQTDTAPPAGAPTCDFRMGRRLTQSGQQARPLWKDVLCRECNAQPGEPCADPLEDRIAWRVNQATNEGHASETVERYWQRLTGNHGRSSAHENLDLTGVPRHIAEHEADEAVDALIAKTGGESPLEHVTRGWAEGIEDRTARELGIPLGPDPWWRRLLQRIHSG